VRRFDPMKESRAWMRGPQGMPLPSGMRRAHPRRDGHRVVPHAAGYGAAVTQLLASLERSAPMPTYAQVAVAGAWEEAMRIEFTATTEINAFDTNVDDPSVAVEIFYTLSDGRTALIGVRYSPVMHAVSSPKEFVATFHDLLAVVPSTSIRDMCARLSEAFDGDPDAYFAGKPAYAEVGVIDSWKSLRPMVVRNQGDAPTTEAALRARLSDNEALLANPVNHVAVEFAFNDPQHWIAIQASEQTNGAYATDVAQLTQLVNML